MEKNVCFAYINDVQTNKSLWSHLDFNWMLRPTTMLLLIYGKKGMNSPATRARESGKGCISRSGQERGDIYFNSYLGFQSSLVNRHT